MLGFHCSSPESHDQALKREFYGVLPCLLTLMTWGHCGNYCWDFTSLRLRKEPGLLCPHPGALESYLGVASWLGTSSAVGRGLNPLRVVRHLHGNLRGNSIFAWGGTGNVLSQFCGSVSTTFFCGLWKEELLRNSSLPLPRLQGSTLPMSSQAPGRTGKQVNFISYGSHSFFLYLV